MNKIKSKVLSGVLAVVMLAGASVAAMTVPELGLSDSLSITASAAAGTAVAKLTNNSSLVYYSKEDPKTLKGYIEGKFVLKSVTGTTSIVKSKKIVYDAKTNRTNVTIVINPVSYKNYKAYFNGTVTKNGKTTNMKFALYNHLCWEYEKTYTLGVGYTSTADHYFLPDVVCAFPAFVTSSDSSVLRVANVYTDSNGRNYYAYTALKAGTASVQCYYRKSGVVYKTKYNVVNGKVYKSSKTLALGKSFKNTAAFDIKEVRTSDSMVAYVTLTPGSRTYNVNNRNKRGTAKITIWYENGSRTEITVTVK